jgi:serine/threonine protein kinase/outer membrane protein assembly factor BamB
MDAVPLLIATDAGRDWLLVELKASLSGDTEPAASHALGKMLVERGILRADQLEAVMGASPRSVARCGACGVRLVIIGETTPSGDGRARPACPQCGAPAVAPAGADTELGPFAEWLMTPRTAVLAVPADADRTLTHAGEPAPAPAPRSGQRPSRKVRGPYTIEGELGRGGMGQVLRATDARLQREVALKVLRKVSAPDEDKERFMLEARVLGRLEHPNIVPVHELVVDDNGQPYFTMKLVRGRALDEILDAIREGRAPPWTPAGAGWTLGAFLEVFLKVCDAVAFAHSVGILHRDLKPANVMIGGFGEVLLMDWGLAKVIGPARRDRSEHAPSRGEGRPGASEGGTMPARSNAPEATRDDDVLTARYPAPPPARPAADPGAATRAAGATISLASATGPAAGAGGGDGGDGQGSPGVLKGPGGAGRAREPGSAPATQTVEGDVLGTPAYMSPEQACGRLAELDERSDVYSLGAILYQILTLHPPHRGSNARETLWMVQTMDPLAPSLRAPQREVPRELETVTLKCLARTREERYASVQDLAADVRRFLEGGLVLAMEYGWLELVRKWLARRRAVVVPVLLSLATALALLVYARTRPGQVAIETVPPGATISSGGRVMGRTPLEIPLTAGFHDLSLELDSHHSLAARVHVSPGAISKYVFPLASTQGILVLSSNPAGADVAILDASGRAVARSSTTTTITVEEGPGYTLEFTRAGYIPVALRDVRIAGGRRMQHHHAALRRNAGRLHARCLTPGGTLTVVAPAAGAGQAARVLGPFSFPLFQMLELESGPHLLTFSGRDCFEQSIPVDVGPGTTVVVSGHPASLATLLERPASLPRGGSVLTLELDGDGRPDLVLVEDGGRVVAIDGSSRRERWAVEVGRGASQAAGGDLDGDGLADIVLNSEGSSDDGSGSASLALRGSTGTMIWRSARPAGLIGSPRIVRRGGAAGSPIVVVATLGGQPGARGVGELLALDARTGRPVWATAVGPGPLTAPAIGDVDQDGSMEVLVGYASGLAAVSGSSGRVVWSAEIPGGICVQPTVSAGAGGRAPDGGRRPPAGPSGPLPASDASDAIVIACPSRGGLEALRARDGRRLWTYAHTAPAAGPAAEGLLTRTERGVVVVTDDQTVHALRIADGTVLWRKQQSTSPLTSPALLDLDGDGALDVAVATRANGLVGLSGGSGQRLLRYESRGAVSGSPAVADLDGDGIADVIAPTDRSVFAVSPAPGWTRWTHAAPHEVAVGPLLASGAGRGPAGPAGRLIALTRAGDLLAIDVRSGVGTLPVRIRLVNPIGLVPADDLLVALSSKEAVGLTRLGEELWRRPAIRATQVAGLALPGGNVALMTREGRITVLNARDGRELCTWEVAPEPRGRPVVIQPARAAAGRGAVQSPEADVGDWRLVVVAGEGLVCLAPPPTGPSAQRPARGYSSPEAGPKGPLAAFGRLPVWRASIDGMEARELTAGPGLDLDADGMGDVVAAGRAPGASMQAPGIVAACSGRTGRLLWRRTAPAGSASLTVLGAGDRIAVCAGTTLTTLAATRGDVLWTRRLPAPSSAPPVAADVDGDGQPDLVVPLADQRMIAFSGAHGTPLGRWAIPWSTSRAPLAVDPGRAAGEPLLVLVARENLFCVPLLRSTPAVPWSVAQTRTLAPGR